MGTDKPEKASPARRPPGDQRAERLAEALRANLKRRKAQARGRDEGSPTAPDRPSDTGEHSRPDRDRD